MFYTERHVSITVDEKNSRERCSADVFGDHTQACRPCGYDSQNGEGLDESVMPETAFELCGR